MPFLYNVVGKQLSWSLSVCEVSEFDESEEDRGGQERGGVAQLGEHLLCKQGVRSSILLISTINPEKGLNAATGETTNYLRMYYIRTTHGRIAQVVRAHA